MVISVIQPRITREKSMSITEKPLRYSVVPRVSLVILDTLSGEIVFFGHGNIPSHFMKTPRKLLSNTEELFPVK